MHGSHASNSSSAANGNGTNGAIANGSGSPRAKYKADGSNGFANGNGSVHANGSFGIQPLQYRGHSRQEVVRLLMQTMQDLGLPGAAQALENESGIELESPSVAALRASVENGEWEEAEQLLLGPEDSHMDGHAGRGHTHGQGLPLKPGTDGMELRFMIREQKYLELLEQRDHGRALMVLRSELTPLSRNTAHLHFLSGLVVASTVGEIKEKAKWQGAKGGSRQQLLQTLSNYIHHAVMIPPHRLTNLLDQVKRNWVEKCIWHNPVEPPSLFVDHACDREQFPLRTVQVLEHIDEVWYLEFSHSGKHLVTCGQDKDVIVYDVSDWEERFRLIGHSQAVAYATWSPDDKWLVTCSRDNTAKLWDATTGSVVATIKDHAEPVTSAAWLPDSTGFCTGSMDATNGLNEWMMADLQQRKPNHKPARFGITNDFRVQDIAIASNGRRVAAISAEESRSRLAVYNLHTYDHEYTINFQTQLTCVRASKDGRYLLLNLANNEIQCLDIETREIVQRFLGQQQGKYIIRSTWAGADENLILSGSQDGKVYVFHRERGTLIETLEGHTGRPSSDGTRSRCVNAVAWNTADSCMFASAGDDKTVRIWSKGNYTPATTRRTSSDISLLYGSHTSLPGIGSSDPNMLASRSQARYSHVGTTATTALL